MTRTAARVVRPALAGSRLVLAVCGARSFAFSLPERRILTTGRCSHYRSVEFSLPITVLTTQGIGILEFSLPDPAGAP